MFSFAQRTTANTTPTTFEKTEHTILDWEYAVTFTSVVLLTIALVLVTALLMAAGAAALALLDEASYPAAIKQAAIVFGAVITLVCAVTAALATVIQ
jgi:hypothetical protein